MVVAAAAASSLIQTMNSPRLKTLAEEQTRILCNSRLTCPIINFHGASSLVLQRNSCRDNNSLLGKASMSTKQLNSDPLVSDKSLTSPIIVIDNYDSFTYNLCQYMGELGCNFEVYRNDELTVEELKRKNPRGVLISPGPGAPQDSGISLETVLELGPIVPLFGVCMGLQCIGEAFGGKIVRSPFGVVHGKGSLVYYDEKGEDGLFAGLPNPFTAGRYHSLVIEKDSFPSDALEVTAWTEDGLIMAARHKKYKHIQGVQFHPESIITSEGKTIVRNFIKMIEKKEAESKN
ncbi:Glutamine amidotransferase [Dillenia turbinata]|uniref:anthranilate synthase n=1 Tax=Dillenia turbinata TaxID=194707 RepID=A0AAN8UUU7_9MAGN